MIIFDYNMQKEDDNFDGDIIVLHSGYCSVMPDYSNDNDIRSNYLIHFCTKGKGVYRTDNKAYEIEKGKGFLTLPNTYFHHKADRYDPWDLCWIAFCGSQVDRLLKDANLGKDNLTFTYDDCDYLESHVRNIYNECRGRRNATIANGYLMLFIGSLIESHKEKSGISRQIPAYFSHYENLVNYILQHIHTRITVEDLADYLCLDVSQIYRIFKSKTGVSPSQYINRLRMKEACGMLTKTDHPIKDIAEWLHFDYTSHFTKQFKSIIGVTPYEYRKANLMRLADTCQRGH